MGTAESKSSITQKSKTNIITNEDISVMNENINKFISDTVVKSASSASNSVYGNQQIEFSDIHSTGPIILNSSQIAKLIVDFSVVQMSDISTELQSGIVNKLQEAIESKFTNSALTNLLAAAEAESHAGAGSTGRTSSKSDISTDSETTISTTTKKALTNRLETVVKNNLNLQDIKDCMSSTQMSQGQKYHNITSDSTLTVFANQDLAINALSKCIQNSKIAGTISNNTMTDLGVKIATTSETTAKTSQESKATAKATSTGPIEDFGNAISGIINSLFRGSAIMYIVSAIVSLCCCCILVAVGYFMFFGGGGGGGSIPIPQMPPNSPMAQIMSTMAQQPATSAALTSLSSSLSPLASMALHT